MPPTRKERQYARRERYAKWTIIILVPVIIALTIHANW